MADSKPPKQFPRESHTIRSGPAANTPHPSDNVNITPKHFFSITFVPNVNTAFHSSCQEFYFSLSYPILSPKSMALHGTNQRDVLSKVVFLHATHRMRGGRRIAPTKLDTKHQYYSIKVMLWDGFVLLLFCFFNLALASSIKRDRSKGAECNARRQNNRAPPHRPAV